jgi:hypothetical protein
LLYSHIGEDPFGPVIADDGYLIAAGGVISLPLTPSCSKAGTEPVYNIGYLLCSIGYPLPFSLAASISCFRKMLELVIQAIK